MIHTPSSSWFYSLISYYCFLVLFYFHIESSFVNCTIFNSKRISTRIKMLSSSSSLHHPSHNGIRRWMNLPKSKSHHHHSQYNTILIISRDSYTFIIHHKEEYYNYGIYIFKKTNKSSYYY